MIPRYITEGVEADLGEKMVFVGGPQRLASGGSRGRDRLLSSCAKARARPLRDVS